MKKHIQHRWKWMLIPEREKVPNTTEEATIKNRTTPTRNLRPQNHRGLAGTPKKKKYE